MSNIQLFNRANRDYLIDYFSEPLRSILVALRKALDEDKALDFSQFFDRLERGEQHLVSRVLLECEQEVEPKHFEHLLERFAHHHWKQMVRSIKNRVKQAQDTDGSAHQLLDDFVALKKKLFDKNH